MSKSPITCHVLDSSSGKPAAGVAVSVHELQMSSASSSPSFQQLASGHTNNDGRCTDLLAPGKLQSGIYKVTFMTGEWMKQKGSVCFYPQVDITFELTNPDEHYHIPLLLSPYGYTTYRGS